MKKTKIFAFDLDGTLLNSYGEILPETIEALDLIKENGDIIFIATGRGLSSTKYMVGHHSHFNFLISSNGSVIYDIEKDETDVSGILGEDIYDEMIKLAEANDNAIFAASGINDIYILEKEDIENKYDGLALKELLKNKKTISKEVMDKDLKTDSFVQGAIRDNEENAKKYFQHLKELFGQKYNIVITNRVFVDVNPLNTTKMHGINEAIKKMQYKDDEYTLYAFGDSDNDIEMVKHADYGYAMGHCTEELAKVAYKVIGSNNENSIAKAIIDIYKK